jgi:hypothetical protein
MYRFQLSGAVPSFFPSRIFFSVCGAFLFRRENVARKRSDGKKAGNEKNGGKKRKNGGKAASERGDCSMGKKRGREKKIGGKMLRFRSEIKTRRDSSFFPEGLETEYLEKMTFGRN